MLIWTALGRQASRQSSDFRRPVEGFSESIKTILRGAFTDPALIYALTLVPVQAADTNLPNVEVLSHRGALMKGLHWNMRKAGWTPKTSSLAAMLLLIGYEYRVDGIDSESMATHLRGLQTMIGSYKARNLALLDDIRRALFWQDLTNCLVAGAPRLLSHKDFKDIGEFRDLQDVDSFKRGDIPCGFAPYTEQWPRTFAVILEDLNALCRLIDTKCGKSENVLANFPIENYQANLESRVVDLLSQTRWLSGFRDPIYEACTFSVYLCTYKLSTGIWAGCYNPEVCVNQILLCVFESVHDTTRLATPELLLWLLHVSGALTVRNHARSQIITMIQSLLRNYVEEYVQDWKATKLLLQNYIWTEHCMEVALFSFWTDLRLSWFSQGWML
jgi:hypothetical protein